MSTGDCSSCNRKKNMRTLITLRFREVTSVQREAWERDAWERAYYPGRGHVPAVSPASSPPPPGSAVPPVPPASSPGPSPSSPANNRDGQNDESRQKLEPFCAARQVTGYSEVYRHGARHVTGYREVYRHGVRGGVQGWRSPEELVLPKGHTHNDVDQMFTTYYK